MGDEDRDTNADGGKMCAAVLLNGKEVNSQDKLGSEEHLQENTLSNARTIAERICDEERSGDETVGNSRSGDSGNELCRNNSKGMKRWYSTDEDQTKSYLKKKKNEHVSQSSKSVRVSLTAGLNMPPLTR